MATPTFTGTAEVDSTVELFRGGTTSLGMTTADGSGDWSFTVGSALARSKPLPGSRPMRFILATIGWSVMCGGWSFRRSAA